MFLGVKLCTCRESRKDPVHVSTDMVNSIKHLRWLSRTPILSVYHQADFEREIWMENIRLMVLKSEALLHSGPKTMKDSSTVTSLTTQTAMGGRRRPIGFTKSLPTLLDHK